MYLKVFGLSVNQQRCWCLLCNCWFVGLLIIWWTVRWSPMIKGNGNNVGSMWRFNVEPFVPNNCLHAIRGNADWFQHRVPWQEKLRCNDVGTASYDDREILQHNDVNTKCLELTHRVHLSVDHEVIPCSNKLPSSGSSRWHFEIIIPPSPDHNAS